MESVLIVDDNEADRVYTTLMLERSQRWGPVRSVSGAEDALRMFVEYEQTRARHPETFPPLLLLLDINMPRMSGFEFLDAYRDLDLPPQRKPSVIVMLSSSQNEADRRRAAAYPVVKGYVTKPLTVAEAQRLADAHAAEDAAT